MYKRIIQFVFFANYFVGLLAVALSVETVCQLGLPLNAIYYYLFLFFATVLYYTWAYTVPANIASSPNPRTEWYRRHHSFIKKSQLVIAIVCALLGIWQVKAALPGLADLPFYYWLLLFSIPVAGILYYGLLPPSFLSINLRNTGWLKPFVIGYVWAGCVSLLPVVVHMTENGLLINKTGLLIWLFVKNWMFCTVNAIMFDIKDYADDANRELKTFAVRFGLNKTISFVLIPLLLIGFVAFIIFAAYNNFGYLPVLINLVPFICLLMVAYSLHQPREILYYLIIIDGLLLIKALCGILSTIVSK
ncbi:MAG: UbiA family prenyltransferase [Sphingobacteriales bacterium]|nr:UbiA family prenyltransferase [Sphingobacteriales bacterium]